MYRYTVTVPRVFNDGTDVPAPVFANVQRWALDTFGGFTRTDSIGAWRDDDGRDYFEPVSVLAIDTSEDRSEDIRAYAAWIGELLAQVAVYVTATAPDGVQSREFVAQRITA